MAIDWTLLEPWYARICASVVRGEPTVSAFESLVSYKCQFQWRKQHVLSLLVNLETDIQENLRKLIQLREAMELFTVHSIVDNKAFTERFRHVTQPISEGDRNWSPSWELYVSGSIPVQQATWNSLFEVSGTSPQFEQAIEMVMTNRSLWYFSDCYDIRIGYACKDVDMLAFIKVPSDGMLYGLKAGLDRVLKACVPLVKQLDLAGDAVKLVDLWRNQSGADRQMDVTLSITIREFTTTYSQVLAALTWLPIHSLKMDFNKENIKMEAEVQLNRDCPVVSSAYEIKCYKMSNYMFAAIDTIQAMRSDLTPIWISVASVDSKSWPLLMGFIYCGPFVDTLLSLNDVVMTNADLLKIADFVVSCRRQSSIGSGVSELLHDSAERNLQVSSTFRWLRLAFTEIESGALLINLLGFIGRNLRSLRLNVARSVDMTLDLSELSATCPNLELLETCRIHVTVSAHTEALCRWPIRELRLDNYAKLSDLILCLRNSNLRMTHELMSIRIRHSRDRVINDNQKRELRIHDGDFLSIREEKVPIRSKAALISVINCARYTEAIHRLDGDVLGIIFAFASIPATRSVDFW